MIAKESLPTLRRRFSPLDHILGHTRLPDFDAELEQLSMDPRCAPQRISDAHPADKLAYLRRYSWSATTTSRLPAPIRSETRAMPTDDCIRLDDRQRITSLGKQSIKTNEYQPIKNTKGLPSRRGSPQNVDLLPKHPDLSFQCCSRSHQVDERPENQPAKISHYAVASADSSLLANWIKFTIGTTYEALRDDPNGVKSALEKH